MRSQLRLMLVLIDGASMGMIALMLALQDAPVSVSRAAMLDISFDLAHPPAASVSPGDILVVGRRRSQRLPPLPEHREDLFPQAQIGLLGGTAAIVGEAKPLLGGVTSNRIMLKWKTKF
jgi:hypothetical protein